MDELRKIIKQGNKKIHSEIPHCKCFSPNILGLFSEDDKRSHIYYTRNTIYLLLKLNIKMMPVEKQRKWEDNVKINLGDMDLRVRTELKWLRIKPHGGLLW
jgi:hypothetical protein